MNGCITRALIRGPSLRGQLRRFFEVARVLVRFDQRASAHLDDLGASDFYLYTNPPGARLCDLCSRPHLLKQRGVAMLITNTIADLRQQIHDDLRRQHPEWVLPNGESPVCDSYEARLIEELDTFMRRGSNESIAAPQRAFEQGTGR